MEAELYTQFSLSNFHTTFVEMVYAHSKVGFRNLTSTELQVLKCIQSQQHKNPQHDICSSTKWGCSVNTGVFTQLVGFLPVHILLWRVGKAVRAIAGRFQGCLCVICILLLSHLTPIWQDANEQPNTSVKQGSPNWNLLLWFFLKLQGGGIRGSVEFLREGGISSTTNFFPLQGVGKQVRGGAENFNKSISAGAKQLSSCVSIRTHCQGSSKHTGAPTLRATVTLRVV